MKILVVSDTHVPTIAQQVPEQVLNEAKSCQMIIHAGDLVSKKVLEALSSIAPTHAVRGNMDLPDLLPTLPSRQLVKVGKWTIGITHGHEGRGADTSQRAVGAFSTDDVDCVVFGHSHVALSETVGDTILFNPGSPVAGRGRRGNSYGILELGETIRTRIVPLKL